MVAEEISVLRRHEIPPLWRCFLQEGFSRCAILDLHRQLHYLFVQYHPVQQQLHQSSLKQTPTSPSTSCQSTLNQPTTSSDGAVFRRNANSCQSSDSPEALPTEICSIGQISDAGEAPLPLQAEASVDFNILPSNATIPQSEMQQLGAATIPQSEMHQFGAAAIPQSEMLQFCAAAISNSEMPHGLRG